MSNMVVRTNIFSLNAHRHMKNVGLEQGRAASRLSSGYRINSAADDAAGLAISETMRAQIRGLDQASSNSQDAQAMMLTAEGGLNEIGNAVQRIRELLVQASNDTNTNDQREMINQEIIQLGREIASSQQRVEFNTNRVLAMGKPINVEISRSVGVLDVDNMRVSAAFQILDDNKFAANTALSMIEELPSGALFSELSERQQQIMHEAVQIIPLDNTTIGSAVHPDVVGDALITHAMYFAPTPVTPFDTITELNNVGPAPDYTPFWPTPVPAGFSVGDMRTALLNRISQIDEVTGGLNNIRANMSNNSRAVFEAIDDFRDETSSGNFRAFFQAGPNSSQGVSFDFEDLSRAVSAAAAVVNTVTSLVANPNHGSGVGRGMEISPLIAELGASVEEISAVRAGLGALQNRLDHTMRSLDISSENLQDSESRVRNADMAREMMRFTMSNVLQQASISMISQGNSLPENLLQILR